MSQGTIHSLPALLRENSYPGRGICVGQTPDGSFALMIYFIMGRSEGSRNRLFYLEGEELRIRLHQQTNGGDTSLILYRPTATHGKRLILTNGDQTDSILSALQAGRSFRQALNQRSFEGDGPHFTPRISAMLRLKKGQGRLQMGLLRSANALGSACDRLYYNYPLQPGEGRFIHTYRQDGHPLPSFEGEPLKVSLPEDWGSFSRELWDSLNPDNRVALMLRAVDMRTGRSHFHIYNRHEPLEGASHG